MIGLQDLPKLRLQTAEDSEEGRANDDKIIIIIIIMIQYSGVHQKYFSTKSKVLSRASSIYESGNVSSGYSSGSGYSYISKY